MVKVRHGKYLLTPEQAGEQLEKAETMHTELKDVVRSWTQAQLNLHQPYLSGGTPDVSISSQENLHGDLLKKIGQNIWCSECRTPWPCSNIDRLRKLRRAVWTGDYEALLASIEATERKETGQLLWAHL